MFWHIPVHNMVIKENHIHIAHFGYLYSYATSRNSMISSRYMSKVIHLIRSLDAFLLIELASQQTSFRYLQQHGFIFMVIMLCFVCDIAPKRLIWVQWGRDSALILQWAEINKTQGREKESHSISRLNKCTAHSQAHASLRESWGLEWFTELHGDSLIEL